MEACSAHIGSISVTHTCARKADSAWAQPLPTSPKPHTMATLPATMTSVARLMPSTSDSRQPYRLSNLDLVTESLTLMAGTASRSEEHTSELQSLMRITYAVFCLKNKNKKINI